MAKAIDYEPAKYNPRDILFHKLEDAPQAHVEALLDLYDIIQLMRDKGLLELAKGALGSGEKVIESLTKTAESQEGISFARNLILLVKLVGGLNPEILENIERALMASAENAKKQKPPGLFKLFGQILSSDNRRVLGALSTVMASVGHDLSKAEEPGLRGEKRLKVTRHRVEKVSNSEFDGQDA
jgi:uncharacterized protein YjgD (DUF1641 family)